jgi:hypothetical protein
MTMPTHHLAQINVARFIRPNDDPANADFMAALAGVNAEAEASPGFVWRLKDETDNATSIEAVPGDPRFIVNLTVWESVDALAAFTYRQRDHLAIMRRRREWFEPMTPALALWWIPAGTVPTVADGLAKLALLASAGPTRDSFTFRDPFGAPDGDVVAPVLDDCA